MLLHKFMKEMVQLTVITGRGEGREKVEGEEVRRRGEGGEGGRGGGEEWEGGRG